MDAILKARKERLLRGEFGHVPSVEEHRHALQGEKEDSALALESITSQILAQTKEPDEQLPEESLKADWDLKRDWNKQHKPLTKETQSAYRKLIRLRHNE